jgi:uncharacterized protein
MTVIIEKNVQVAMRDGVALATDIYRPGDDDAHPTVVIRLPYNKELSATLSSSLDVMRAVGAGYVVVARSIRSSTRLPTALTPSPGPPPSHGRTARWAWQAARTSGLPNGWRPPRRHRRCGL